MAEMLHSVVKETGQNWPGGLGSAQKTADQNHLIKTEHRHLTLNFQPLIIIKTLKFKFIVRKKKNWLKC